MKKVTDGFDPARLEGRELESVLYASNLATLQFGEGILSTILAQVAMTQGDGRTRAVESPPWSSTRLPSLIGHFVKSASTDPTRRLIIRLDDESILELLPDESGYESFIIAADGEEWVA